MTKSDDKVPALRFKGFTDEWEQRKLGDVAEIVGGGTPSTNISKYWNGNINWYSPTEIGSQTFVNSSKKKITELGLKESSAKLLPGKKTILFTSRAGIGDMAIMNTDGSTNQGFQSWIVKPNITDIYFLYSLGGNLKKQALRKASGSTFLEISNSEVKKLSLYLPNFKEQTIIGKIIKLIDKLITLQQRNLENYLLIKKKLSNIFFNDRIVNKNDLLFEHRVKANQLFISYSKKGFSHLPVLSASQDKGMIFRKDESKNILYTHDNLTSYKLVEPDNFVVHLRSFQAGFAYSDKTGIASPAYTIFKFKNNVAYNSVYWKEKFKSYNFIQLLKKITYGVRDGRSISFSDFLSLYLTFPDIKLQNKIGNVLSKLDTQISDQKEIIKKLENIKQFLLQNMFI